MGLISGSGRSPGEGNGNPLQYSCLKNPMDRGAWRVIVHGVAKNWVQLITKHMDTEFWHCKRLEDISTCGSLNMQDKFKPQPWFPYGGSMETYTLLQDTSPILC